MHCCKLIPTEKKGLLLKERKKGLLLKERIASDELILSFKSKPYS